MAFHTAVAPAVPAVVHIQPGVLPAAGGLLKRVSPTLHQEPSVGAAVPRSNLQPPI